MTFAPFVGDDVQKTRPVIFVSNDAANVVPNAVQVVPISSRTERLYAAEAYVSREGNRRQAMAADQPATANRRRLLRRSGALGEEDVKAVNRVVRLQLDL